MWVGVFPGQGAQYVGIGKTLYDQFPFFRQFIEEAEDVFKRSLGKVFFEGSAQDLQNTENAQVAVFLKSMGLWQALVQEKGLSPYHFSVLAGHSLGEYTALCAAQALSLSQTLALLKARTRCMTQHAPAGSMAAILGLTREEVQPWLKDHCLLANDNSPQQLIISGLPQAMEVCVSRIKEQGIRVIPLKVSGPFHTSFMQGAQDAFNETLSQTTFETPKVPVISNTTATPSLCPKTLKDNLSSHMIQPVLWTQTQRYCAQVGKNLVEIGPGKVLQGLAKQTVPQMSIFGITKAPCLSDPTNALFFSHLAQLMPQPL